MPASLGSSPPTESSAVVALAGPASSPAVAGADGSSLAQVAAGLLAHLYQRTPLAIWALARRDVDDCVLEAVAGSDEPAPAVRGARTSSGSGGALAAGSRFAWSATVCSRMVRGGPRAVPDVRRVPEYASAPLARRLPIGAYVGVPVHRADGSLVGSLFGLDPSSRADDLSGLVPLLEVFAGVLGAAVDADDALARERRRTVEAERRAVTDALTGLVNRLGWDEALDSEQSRAARRQLSTGLVSVDLDDLKQVNDQQGHAAGDELLVAAADALRSVVRREDVLARVGGDEYAVLASDCDDVCLERLVERLRSVLDRVGVRASLGSATVPAGTSLATAWRRADEQMYAEKRSSGHRQLDLDLTDAALAGAPTTSAPDVSVLRTG